ncbi:hypothetical protein [Aneurinibacillus tyrosinisolvens]|uniref:hypothetical protein n=1 Tax=Aneurinibacillus tyrosinisolvens TaxID=1443435 RepID=UPI00063F8592|nr:hypothetical protein [Aneurinibacillus tyrosinisolvens]
MNHFQIGLTQQTLSNFITVLCNNYVHEEADVLILDEDGVRIVGNVIAHLGPPNRVKLEEPNKLSVEHLTLLFERFQVVLYARIIAKQTGKEVPRVGNFLLKLIQCFSLCLRHAY